MQWHHQCSLQVKVPHTMQVSGSSSVRVPDYWCSRREKSGTQEAKAHLFLGVYLFNDQDIVFLICESVMNRQKQLPFPHSHTSTAGFGLDKREQKQADRQWLFWLTKNRSLQCGLIENSASWCFVAKTFCKPCWLLWHPELLPVQSRHATVS